jgi:hypothetical protein
MMEKAILSEIYMLPETLKLEVWRYIVSLNQNYSYKKVKQKSKKRKAGSAKGKYIMQSDFNEPLEEFKD